jgi:uncharacterized repeat protein (TIGR03803 family)
MRIFSVILFAIVLASCSRTGGTSLVPAGLPNGDAPALNAAVGSGPSLARQHSGNHGYKELYAFNGASGGAGYPVASLIDMTGKLYGTTEEGGAAGFGTVFEVSKSGKESVLYSFGGTPDGAYPVASLIALNGEFYGTTESGGSGCTPSGGCGTVFEVSASGKESTLYSFKGGTDGSGPAAALIAVNGELYGTTTGGGKFGGGTAFKVSTSGNESVIHTFRGGLDGAYPYAGLTALHGALYGTTFGGGLNYGMVFKMSMSGKVHVIYSFNPNNGMDGNAPDTGVIALNGMLYGTTPYGGTNGYGAVYEVSTSGQERVLSSNVDDPQASLVAVNGEFYGTTYGGGIESQGTVFKMSTSGKESSLYNFGGNPDGSAPAAGLIAVNGVLYGTTESGGPDNVGTVFKISP